MELYGQILRAVLVEGRSQRAENLLFSWFVGLDMDDAMWNHAAFLKNRDRLLTSEVTRRFFAEVNR